MAGLLDKCEKSLLVVINAKANAYGSFLAN